MLTIHPQYIKDINGNNSFVVIPAAEFDLLMEELDDIHDIKLYDEVKRHDSGERIAIDDAFKMIEAARKSK